MFFFCCSGINSFVIFVVKKIYIIVCIFDSYVFKKVGVVEKKIVRCGYIEYLSKF